MYISEKIRILGSGVEEECKDGCKDCIDLCYFVRGCERIFKGVKSKSMYNVSWQNCKF